MDSKVYKLANELKDQYWWFLGREKIISAYLQPFITKDLKILDIGCGSATSINILKPYGKVWGIDKNIEAIHNCKNQGYFHLEQTNINNYQRKKNYFDLLAALDLLEHVRDDTKILNRFAYLLKPEGLLLITVPAFQQLWSENDESVHHFRRYNMKELKTKLEKSNFKIIRISYFNTFLFPLYLFWLFFKKLSRIGKVNIDNQSVLDYQINPIINFIFYKIFIIESFFLKLVNFPLGLSIICLAKVNLHVEN